MSDNEEGDQYVCQRYETDLKKHLKHSEIRVKKLKKGMLKDWRKEQQKQSEIPFLRTSPDRKNSPELEQYLSYNEPVLPKLPVGSQGSIASHIN